MVCNAAPLIILLLVPPVFRLVRPLSPESLQPKLPEKEKKKEKSALQDIIL